MISYAGVPTTPQPGAVEAVAAWWHGHRIDDFEFQGYFVPGIQHLPTPYHPKREEPRLGVLHWPTAADKFATCYLAVDAATKTKITTAVASTSGLGELVINDGAGGVVSTAMYLIATHPISTRSGTEYTLLVLADPRYFWWQTGAGEIEGGATWAALFASLFTILGASSTVSSVPSAYLTPNPARWELGAQPIPPVLQAAALTVGLRPAVQLDGSVLVQNYATALAADSARWLLIRYECLAGGQIPGADIARGLPAAVDTSFFDGTSTTTTLASLSLAIAGGQTGVVATKGLVVADPAAPTSSQKTAYAAQAAADYYNWAFSRTDCTLRGAVNVVPNGLDEAIEWINTTETVLTRIIRPPLSDRNLYGQAAQGGGESTSTQISSCSWLAGLVDTDCLILTVVSATGLCSEIDTTQVVVLEWDSGDTRWEGLTDFTSDAGAGAVVFDDPDPPTLTIDGESGRYLGCDGTGGLLFAFGKSPLCTEGSSGTCNNSFVVRIACSCCPIDGWLYPAWYCARPTDGGECTALYISENDKCDSTVTICSGPYADEATATAACTESIYSTPGTYSGTVPYGRTGATVGVWGGGGAGGNTLIGVAVGLGGGGGGGYSQSTISGLTPGDSFTVVVGAGGDGTSNPVTSGADSYFSLGVTTVEAKGGQAGAVIGSGGGGTGGQASAGQGTTKYSGGDGGDPSDEAGGGGGGSGGVASNGNNGANAVTTTPGAGGALVTGGGQGGTGSVTNVTSRATLGGGGGGAGPNTGAGDYDGGDGADGRVRISWS